MSVQRKLLAISICDGIFLKPDPQAATEGRAIEACVMCVCIVSVYLHVRVSVWLFILT